jgi:hypothetical protein
MKKYKVLTKIGNEYFSPFKNFKYGKLEDFIDKEMTTVCDLSDNECSSGFYATDVEGIVYSYNRKKNSVVFEVEVEVKIDGEYKIFNEYKQRFSTQKFIREIPLEELKELIKNQSDKMNWNYYESVFPIDVKYVNKDNITVTDEVIMLLKEWDSVRSSVRDSIRGRGSVRDSIRGSVGSNGSIKDSIRDSIRNSIRDSVGYSVGDSIRNSVWDSVRDSVWDSVRDSIGDSVWDSIQCSINAYTGSFFPNIVKWKGIDHEEGIYPFESGAKLWKKGFIPTYDEEIWRLHQGKDMEVVFEIDRNELLKYEVKI